MFHDFKISSKVFDKTIHFPCSLFASEQYFDSPGLFISVVFSTPMLFNSLIIIVSILNDYMLNSYTKLELLAQLYN